MLDVSAEDVNKIVVAFPTPRPSPSPLSKPQLQKQAEQIASCLSARKQAIKQDVDVVDIVKGFELLTLGTPADNNNNNSNNNNTNAAKKKKKKNNKKK